MKGMALLGLAAIALVGCEHASAPMAPENATRPEEGRPHFDVVENEQRVPFNVVHVNPCTGESIAFSGYLHTKISSTVSQSGGVHLSVMVDETSLTGVGAVTGTLYRASSELLQTDNLEGPPPLESTVIDDFRIIAPQPNNNFYMYIKLHLTTNANGVQTADVASADARCQ